jgi:hypothetical protein
MRGHLLVKATEREAAHANISPGFSLSVEAICLLLLRIASRFDCSMTGSSDRRQRGASDVAVAWDSLRKPVFRKLAVK